jgi:hypothetical protein
MPVKTAQKLPAEDCSIIALDKFIQATRDSGYKGTASAIAELVDNSIQAGASRISITVGVDADADIDGSIQIAVLDNGCGMDPFTLRQALRFGGSSRFNDRSSLGRYGMGLPNASLSQAQRVMVYTWRTETPSRPRPVSPTVPVYLSYLDVGEIVRNEIVDVPRPQLVKEPPSTCKGKSGTLVKLSRCDRLENRRISTILRKLEGDLSRRFRHYIWKGLRISLNGDVVSAFDPLYLQAEAGTSCARLFGEELRYEVRAIPSDPKSVGWVTVRFSELPVDEWHKLSNEEKRRRGISQGAGVSIVRAGREVDYGWFFMGSKHRENYDDWWRCEIQFEPILDEAFGITHTKQQIRPQVHLIDELTPDLEATARALNARARKAHLAVKTLERFSAAETIANNQNHLLKPLPTRAEPASKALAHQLTKHHPNLRNHKSAQSHYTIVESAIKDASFFTYAYDGKKLILVINPEHPFYREIYKSLADGESPRDQELRVKLELLLLSAVRSQVALRGNANAHSRFRVDWSNTLATFLNGK